MPCVLHRKYPRREMGADQEETNLLGKGGGGVGGAVVVIISVKGSRLRNADCSYSQE